MMNRQLGRLSQGDLPPQCDSLQSQSQQQQHSQQQLHSQQQAQQVGLHPLIQSHNLHRASGIFRVAKCKDHADEEYRNFCVQPGCMKPLCPECIQAHNAYHRSTNTEPNIKSLKVVQSACREKLVQMRSQLDQLYDDVEFHGHAAQHAVDADADKGVQKILEYQRAIQEHINDYFESLLAKYRNRVNSLNAKTEQTKKIQDKLSFLFDQLELLQLKLEEPQIDALNEISHIDLTQDMFELKNQIQEVENAHSIYSIDIITEDNKIRNLKNDLRAYVRLGSCTAAGVVTTQPDSQTDFSYSKNFDPPPPSAMRIQFPNSLGNIAKNTKSNFEHFHEPGDLVEMTHPTVQNGSQIAAGPTASTANPATITPTTNHNLPHHSNQLHHQNYRTITPLDQVIKESENESFPQHDDTDLFLGGEENEDEFENNLDEQAGVRNTNMNNRHQSVQQPQKQQQQQQQPQHLQKQLSSQLPPTPQSVQSTNRYPRNSQQYELDNESQLPELPIGVTNYFEQTCTHKHIPFYSQLTRILYLIDVNQFSDSLNGSVVQKSSSSAALRVKSVNVPAEVVIGEFHRLLVSPRGDIFLLGGVVKNVEINRAYKFDYSSNNNNNRGGFTELQPMNTPRSSFAAIFAEKSAIFVIGGKRGGIPSAECERYDITTNKWLSIASLNLAAYACSACTFNKRDIYKYGGIGPGQQENNNTIEKYDLQRNTWETINLMHEDITGVHPLKQKFILFFNSAAVQINATTMFIFGGQYQANTTTSNFCLDVIPKQSGQNTQQNQNEILADPKRLSQSLKNTNAAGDNHILNSFDYIPTPSPGTFTINPIIHNDMIIALQNIEPAGLGASSQKMIQSQSTGSNQSKMNASQQSQSKRVITFNGLKWTTSMINFQ